MKFFLQRMVVGFFNFWTTVNVKNLANLPTGRPFILVLNHISYLDPMIVTAFLCNKNRIISPVATQGLFRFPLAGLLKALDAIAVDRKSKFPREYLQQVINALDSRAVLVFPEGGVKRYPQGKMPSGIGYLIGHTDVPIIPVRITGTDDVMKKGSYRIKRKPISLIIGEAIPRQQFSQKNYAEISLIIMQTIYGLDNTI
jgi:1-acyl-sn-glycerol-3-phosphate acyltransferase